MAFGTTAGSAAAGRPPRLGPPRVLAFFFQWNEGRKKEPDVTLPLQEFGRIPG